MAEINSPKYKYLDVYFDSSYVPGEGEHKILKYIRENDIDGNIVIYGLNAENDYVSTFFKNHTYICCVKP